MKDCKIKEWKWGGIIFLTLILIYSFFIEPNWIETNYFEFEISIDRTITIAQLSDIHIVKFGNLEEKVITILNQKQPDVIVITGDLVSRNGKRNEYKKFLSKLSAPLGVFYVKGNWEHWNPVKDFLALLNETKVELLNNENKKIYKNIYLIGFDDAYEGRVDIESSLFNIPKNAFKIGLFHSPKFFEQIFNKIDLAFSGHSHGGQIQIPFLGPIITPYGTGTFSNGWFEKNGSKMYVNRGIGTSILNVRLFSRPEVCFVKLVPR